uniref:Uncharacterized protein n=1 Tax=Picea glauca TaxID=3330 RepID=A0A117NIT4_PICGL|nr:hypothetical protein ABT39_MTgene323 [Picea glauca]QHR90679.1 hypothetical protein Q903MT_gene4704 [Picea sitchensis]
MNVCQTCSIKVDTYRQEDKVQARQTLTFHPDSLVPYPFLVLQASYLETSYGYDLEPTQQTGCRYGDLL